MSSHMLISIQINFIFMSGQFETEVKGSKKMAYIQLK